MCWIIHPIKKRGVGGHSILVKQCVSAFAGWHGLLLPYTTCGPHSCMTALVHAGASGEAASWGVKMQSFGLGVACSPVALWVGWGGCRLFDSWLPWHSCLPAEWEKPWQFCSVHSHVRRVSFFLFKFQFCPGLAGRLQNKLTNLNINVGHPSFSRPRMTDARINSVNTTLPQSLPQHLSLTHFAPIIFGLARLTSGKKKKNLTPSDRESASDKHRVINSKIPVSSHSPPPIPG